MDSEGVQVAARRAQNILAWPGTRRALTSPLGGGLSGPHPVKSEPYKRGKKGALQGLVCRMSGRLRLPNQCCSSSLWPARGNSPISQHPAKTELLCTKTMPGHLKGLAGGPRWHHNQESKLTWRDSRTTLFGDTATIMAQPLLALSPVAGDGELALMTSAFGGKAVSDENVQVWGAAPCPQ